MNRIAAGVLIAFLGGPLTALAQVSLPPPQQPAPVQPAQVLIERQDARQTRDELHRLLRQHPPAVGEVLRSDPTLARADYLAPYPALVAFLQQHPEVTRNPSFFFGAYAFRDDPPPDRAYRMFNDVVDGFGFLLIFGSLLGAAIWLVRSVVDQRRWLRVARTQAEVHGKLLDRLTNNEDLLTYIQTPAGRRFLESGPLMASAEPSKPVAAPLSRIILPLQAGIVLTFLGVGFWIAQSRFPDDMSEGFFIIGTLATALGVGFAVSAGLAYAISARFGLIASPPAPTHD